MLKRPEFWWGASFALGPALVGSFAVSYSGMAAFNALWPLLFGRESSGILMVFGGILYGAVFGALFPCLLFGAVAHFVWRLTSGRLAPILGRTLFPTRVLL